ncbi:MAG: helix-turn-helix domain-containing protein [Thermoleophilia bacterium]
MLRSDGEPPGPGSTPFDRARLQVLLDGVGPRYLTVADAARIAGFSRRAVYRSIERGELNASLVCSRLRIHPDDFLVWIEGAPALVRGVPAPVAVSVVRQAAAAAEGLRSMLARQDTAA